MRAQDAEQLTLDFLPQKPVVVQRHPGQITSDAGLLAIRQFDQRRRYTQRMADCLVDRRCDPDHTALDMLRQRLYGILADYPDCNDHTTLRNDPVFKLVTDRQPEDPALASQPTLSRFENSVDVPSLMRLNDFLTAIGLEQLAGRHSGRLPERVTLDVDPTDDPTHGQQQLTLFHAYYDQYQYLPLMITEPTTRHVFRATLRPGAVHAALGADDDLMDVVGALRAKRPDIAIHVRGDSGFGVPWMYKICEKNGLTYTFGLASNARLRRAVGWLLRQAVGEYERTGRKQRLFTAFSYRADSWDRWRTVVVKVECHSQGTNVRFVITNLPLRSLDDPRRIYDDYIQRGASEHRMDETKNGLSADRLSCHRFMANYWRLLLHVATFNLLNALRDHGHVPAELRHAQPAAWRTRLIKVAATVVQTTRRVLVELAAQWPHWRTYRAVSFRALGAMPAGP